MRCSIELAKKYRAQPVVRPAASQVKNAIGIELLTNRVDNHIYAVPSEAKEASNLTLIEIVLEHYAGEQ